jgi:hypothetical protein
MAGYLSRKVSFVKRWLYRRYIFTLILESVFFVNAIPQWTIFVLRSYVKEKKQIDQVLTAVEKLIIRSATGGGTGSKILERFV